MTGASLNFAHESYHRGGQPPWVERRQDGSASKAESITLEPNRTRLFGTPTLHFWKTPKLVGLWDKDLSDITEDCSKFLSQFILPQNFSHQPGTIEVKHRFGLSRHVFVSWYSFPDAGTDSVLEGTAIAHTDAAIEENEGNKSTVVDELLRVLRAHAEDDFEPGFVSPLERELNDLVHKHRVAALRAMLFELNLNRISTPALGEMVRAIGRMRAVSINDMVFQVCVHSLEHPELEVRDAAALALCDLEDPRAASPIREAAASETNVLVRNSHLEVANWLDSLPACQT